MAGYKEVKELIDTHMGYVREDLGEIKEHLGKINGHLDDHSYRIKQAEDDIELAERLAEERHRPSKKAIGGGIAGSIAIIIALIKGFFFPGSP